MVANTFWALLGLGCLTGAIPAIRYKKAVAFLVWLAAGVLFFGFIRHMLLGGEGGFSFRWLEYQSLHVDISLSSSAAAYAQIFPVFLLSWIALLVAVFNADEADKTRFMGMVLLNLCAFFLLICSDNLIQLLISSCLITTIGFYIINDTEARRKYVFYNLLVDMFLFTVFAVIYGSLGNLGLEQLEKFEEMGAHRDLVAFLLVSGVFLKSGLFLFHNQLLDLSSLHFNRMIYMLNASTPLAGLIILAKTQVLLSASGYAAPLIQILSVLTLVWAALNAMVMDNIKERAVYYTMMFYAYIYILISLNHLELYTQLPLLVICAYLLNLNICLIYQASSYELYASKMGGFISGMRFTFVLSLFAVFVILQTVLGHCTETIYHCGTVFAVFMLIALAHLYHQVYFGEKKADERVMALLRNPAWYLLIPAIIIAAALVWLNHYWPARIFYVYAGFLLLIVVYPFRKLENLAELEALQEEDYFEKLYNAVIITPIKILGRILWLLVDFILIERTIISSLNQGTALLIRAAGWINSPSAWRWLALSVFGIGAMFLCYYVRR